MTDAQTYVQTLLDSCKSVSAKDAADKAGLPMTLRGDRYWSRCFLHADDTASLVFYPDGRYYCFSCKASGDAAHLYQQMYDLSPLDAAKRLMSEFGMSAPSADDVKPTPIKPRVTASALKETVERTRERRIDELLTIKRNVSKQIDTIEQKANISETDRQRVFDLTAAVSAADVMLNQIDAMSPQDLVQWVAKGASIDAI